MDSRPPSAELEREEAGALGGVVMALVPGDENQPEPPAATCT